MAFIDNIKPWFETNDKPTQAQFYQVFDWLRWKDEFINMADITGLVNALLGKVNTSDYEGQLIAYDAAATYVVPNGWLLEKIIPYWGEAGAISVSEVQMGDSEIINMEDLAAGWIRPITVDVFAGGGDKNVYIDGVPAGSKIVFLKRKIKMA